MVLVDIDSFGSDVAVWFVLDSSNFTAFREGLSRTSLAPSSLILISSRTTLCVTTTKHEFVLHYSFVPEEAELPELFRVASIDCEIP